MLGQISSSKISAEGTMASSAVHPTSIWCCHDGLTVWQQCIYSLTFIKSSRRGALQRGRPADRRTVERRGLKLAGRLGRRQEAKQSRDLQRKLAPLWFWLLDFHISVK